MWSLPQHLPDASKEGFSSQHLPTHALLNWPPTSKSAASLWPLDYASFFAGYLSALLPLLHRIPILGALTILNAWNHRHGASSYRKSLNHSAGKNLRIHTLQLHLVIARPRAVIMGLPAGPPAPDHSPPLGQPGPLPWLWQARDCSPHVPPTGQACP